MNLAQWQWLKRLPALLAVPRREPAERARRIVAVQRNIILPARLLMAATVFYYLYNTPWLGVAVTTYGVVFETLQNIFAGYALMVVVVAVLFSVVRRFPPGAVQWIVFTIGLGDGVFLAGLTVLTGGFESILFWGYPTLIVLNAVSIPLATPQIILNLVLAGCFMAAGLVETGSHELELSLSSPRPHKSPTTRLTAADFQDLKAVNDSLQRLPPPLSRILWDSLSETTRQQLAQANLPPETEAVVKAELAQELNNILFPTIFTAPNSPASTDPPEIAADPYVLRLAVLILLTFCCYGLQVLVAAQRRVEEDQKEFVVRSEQLRAAGRLAAEFAHQIKNPLAIINNVTYSLQKALPARAPETAQQIGIIQEEVAKADQIITQIMGYAQLSEGRVEKLDVCEEIERILASLFPPSVPSEITLHRQFAESFPPLLMQRRHFTDSVGNVLQNAREALDGPGHIYVAARCLGDYSVEVVVRDDGPGIPPDKLERIFEAYYTTKTRGSGLGLAIVKHNVGLYGGDVRVESALGKGTKFTLLFPAKSWVKLGK
jgi:signal transduction histidine kinase